MLLSTLLAQTEKKLGEITPPSTSFSRGSALNGNIALKNFELFISSIIGILTVIAGLSFVFYFVLAAINWTTAGGEKGKIEKARDQMIQSAVGLVIVIMAYGLLGVIGGFLGLNILRPGLALQNIFDSIK